MTKYAGYEVKIHFDNYEVVTDVFTSISENDDPAMLNEELLNQALYKLINDETKLDLFGMNLHYETALIEQWEETE